MYDGAYWLRGVRAADDKALRSATVESLGGSRTGAGSREGGADRGRGGHPGPTGRTAGTLLRTVPAFDPAAARRSNALTLTSRNTRALALDLRRARVRVTRRGLRITVDADAPIRLELRRVGHAEPGWPSTASDASGVWSGRKRTMTVSVPVGKHSVFLRAVRRRR